MSSPQSFMVGSPPQGAGYAGRLMDFGMLSNLGADYYGGQAAQRANAAATAFPKGIPTVGDVPLSQGGKPDVNAILDVGGRTMGLPFLQGLLPFMMINSGRPAAGYNTGQGQPQPQGPAPSTADQNHAAGASSANLQIAMQGNGTQENPYRPRSKADFQEIEAGSYFVTPNGKVAVRRGGGQQSDQAVMQSPLADDSTEKSINGMGTSPRTGEGAGGGVSGAPGPPPSSTVAGPPGPINTPPSSFNDRFPGRVAQTQRVPAPAPAPAPQAGARDIEPPAPNVPQGMTNDQAVRQLNNIIKDKTDEAAGVAAIAPGRAAVLTEEIKELAKQRDDIVAHQRTYRERTITEKDAAASGAPSPENYQARVEANKLMTKRMDEVVGGYYGQANTAAQTLPDIKLARAFISNPNFYSGSLQSVNLAFKRMLSSVASTPAGRAMGLDPTMSLSQEGFKKVMAANILNQVASLKTLQAQSGEQAGRIFQSQIELMQNAAQNPENSIAANRALTEIQWRSANHALEMSKAITKMKQEYKATHGGLVDDGFNNKITDYMEAHPMFTDKELADPTLLGAVNVPPNMGVKTPPEKFHAWASSVGLQRGEPFRTPDGDIRYYHPVGK